MASVTATYAGRGGPTLANETQNIIINKPATCIDGSVLYAVIYHDTNLAPSGVPGTTAGTSWVLVASQADATNLMWLGVYRKIIVDAASEPTTFTWTYASASSTAGMIGAFWGVDLTTPEDGVTPTKASGPASGYTIPSITTATARALVVAFLGLHDDTPVPGTVLCATGPTLQNDGSQISSGGSDSQVCIKTGGMVTPGPTGTATIQNAGDPYAGILVSIRSSDWIPVTSGFSTSLISRVKWAPASGEFAAIAVTKLASSPTGATWTQETAPLGAFTVRGLEYGNGQWMVGGDSGKISTSPDLTTWTPQTNGFSTNAVRAVAYGDGTWVAVGDAGHLEISVDDGGTWTPKTSTFGSTVILNVAYGNGLFVAVGNSGLLATSTDGNTWNARTSGFSATTISSALFARGGWIAVGASGKYSTSLDGLTWTAQTALGSATLNDIAYGNGLYVIGENGQVWVSPDGVAWTAQAIGFSAAATAYGPGRFAIGGGGTTGRIATSTQSASRIYRQAGKFVVPQW